MNLMTRLRRWAHRDCDKARQSQDAAYQELNSCYERLEADYNGLAAAAHRTDEALSESADAHEETATELDGARERITELEAALARVRADADQVRAANTRALEVLRGPLSLGLDHTDPLEAAEKHQVMIWFGLTELAIRMERGGYSESGERLRAMAEVHRQRLAQALTELDGPEHAVELRARLEYMAVLPLERAVT